MKYVSNPNGAGIWHRVGFNEGIQGFFFAFENTPPTQMRN